MPRPLSLIFRPLLALAIVAAPAPAKDWPHWRGPDRNGHSKEVVEWSGDRGLSEKPAWSANFGKGGSSVVVAKGVVYAIGWADGKDIVHALDAATGKVRWRQSYAAPEYGRRSTGDKGFYAGATATPEFDPSSGLLFTLGCDGDLRCWDTASKGESKWQLNLYERYGIPRRPQMTKRRNSLRDYGYTSAPLVLGDQVLLEVGSPEHGNVIAFDKRTGRELWRSENRDPAGHSGGLCPLDVEGVPCVAVITARHLHVLRLDMGSEGRTVALFPWITDFINNIPTPTVAGPSRLLVTSRYNIEAMACVEIGLKTGAREVWRAKEASGVCSPVVHDGRVFWANKSFYCLDAETGRKRYEGPRFSDAGSCILTGDGRILVWANAGDLFLVESGKRSPQEYKVVAERRRIFSGMAWPHVVLAGGRIYCKEVSGAMKVFEVGSR